MHVEQYSLFVSVVWPQNTNKYYNDRPSLTKDRKPKQAEVQIPSSSGAYQQ